MERDKHLEGVSVIDSSRLNRDGNDKRIYLPFSHSFQSKAAGSINPA